MSADGVTLCTPFIPHTSFTLCPLHPSAAHAHISAPVHSPNCASPLSSVVLAVQVGNAACLPPPLPTSNQYELLGGGFKGNYSVATHGGVTIELEDGSLGSPVGSINAVAQDGSIFAGNFSIVSDTGDVDLTFLSSAV